MSEAVNGTWSIVRTHVRAEAKAAYNLQRQGFKTYLPLYLKRTRHARKVQDVASPLFPRYLFVTLNGDTQDWRSIKSTFGVAQLVCIGENPAVISRSVVSELKSRENSQGFVCLKPRIDFHRGERLRVVDGVFASCLGLFEEMTDRERITVLIDLLGRKVRVIMDYGSVAAA